MLTSHIILMGLRGSGKSTLGRELALRMGCAFSDLDEHALSHLGYDTVAACWEDLGEAAFRRAEVQALASLLEAPAHVISLGGGTPTAPGAAELLQRARFGTPDKAGALVIYLREQPAQLRARLASDPDFDQRPPLTARGTLDEVDEVFQARDPLYRRLAGLILESPDIEHLVRLASAGAP